ncbi:MAG: beta-galactosidase, partial [Lachnospiraceae bacterium]|nr:beta-galactosidase [Lachnospiraceae bacterium]
MSKLLNGEAITLGTCYYPEHWDESLWREDLERMFSVGITTVRIAEFAWSKVEEKEGQFNFDFFDKFLDLTDELGMQVIMGTPTATPPAWLTEKYPDVLNAKKDGTLFRHGLRRHYNYNSENYKRLSKIIVEKFAEHYGKRKSVIGWQIDNEINCEIAEFYSESDDKAFNVFLKNKY